MRNRVLKTLSAICLASAIYLCLAPACHAIEPLELHMEGVTAKDGELRIYCNSNSENAPVMDDFAVTLGNAALPVKSAAGFGNADLGASYIFLVDVSGSIKQSQLQGIKDTLAEIGGNLGENDNVSVIDIGNGTYTQPFVSGNEDIQNQIDAIKPRGENTNLYESVVKSLSILKTHENCHDKKILVILSDGEEYSVKGITLDEAAIKIEASHIPIYTIAMLGQNPPDQYVETAKILGSFARFSAGGRHYVHSLDKAASKTIAGDILDSIRKSMIVTADLSGFRSDGGDMALRLELTVAGMGKANDGYAIPTAGLSAPPEEESAPSSSTSTAESETQPKTGESEPPAELDVPPDTEQPPKQNNLVWVIVAALTAAGIVAFIIIRHKKAAKPLPVPVQEEQLPDTMPITAPVRPSASAPPPGKPRIALRLTKIGLIEELVFRAEFAGELIIGRDASKAALPFPNDELLSAKHCSISYEPEGIVLRDLGSTNRTFVNGVPIQDKYILEKDDVLLIGSMELRVNWDPLCG